MHERQNVHHVLTSPNRKDRHWMACNQRRNHLELLKTL